MGSQGPLQSVYLEDYTSKEKKGGVLEKGITD